MKRTVIQFGEGNFLRGFFDAFLDEMNEKGLYDGRAVIVQPRAGGKCALLKAQGCRYNLYLRGVENGEVKELHRTVGAVADALDPYTASSSRTPRKRASSLTKAAAFQTAPPSPSPESSRSSSTGAIGTVCRASSFCPAS